jgi:tyrosinase
MQENRRQFLRQTAIGFGWMAVGIDCATFDSCVQQIANRPTRRDINTLAANDPIVQAYKSAVTQMKALPGTDRRNWNNQADIHANFCPHGNWFFLPWHRWYLSYFERICRKLSGMQDFALPYWNWTKNPTVPAVFWGGAGNPLFDSTRTIGQNDAISSSVVGSCVVDQILNDTNFLTFGSDSITLAQDQRTPAGSGALEATPHNNVHGAVGGDMGRVSLSPRDPIFWLHHNMIERCWVEWNLVRNHPNTNHNDWTSRHFTEFCDEDGNPVDVRVDTGLLLPVLSYQFDDLPTVNPCGAPGAHMLAPQPTPGGSGQAGGSWKKVNHPENRAAQDSLKALAQAGAAVRLDVIQRFASRDGRIVVPLAKPVAVRLGAETATLRGALEGGRRILVRFNGVTMNHTGDFFVKVFLNKPDATASTPDTDPHFVGGFGFFDHQHAGHPGPDTGNFHLDVSVTARRLGIEGTEVGVTIALAPFPGRQPQTMSLEITSMELQIVADVIERQNK